MPDDRALRLNEEMREVQESVSSPPPCLWTPFFFGPPAPQHEQTRARGWHFFDVQSRARSHHSHTTHSRSAVTIARCRASGQRGNRVTRIGVPNRKVFECRGLTLGSRSTMDQLSSGSQRSGPFPWETFSTTTRQLPAGQAGSTSSDVWG